MLKKERQDLLLQLLEQGDVLKVTDAAKVTQTTPMTIRRDFVELEDAGYLTRIHGGALLKEAPTTNALELSHLEKREINQPQKHQIARLIAQEIQANETIFLGAGTTLELVSQYLKDQPLKIVTNSFHLLEQFKYDDRFELFLIGGNYRSVTGAFYGSVANQLASRLNVHRAFVACNALYGHQAYCRDSDEGQLLQTILANASQTYLVADYSKFNTKDFYQFHTLTPDDYLITDDQAHLAAQDYQDIAGIIQP